MQTNVIFLILLSHVCTFYHYLILNIIYLIKLLINQHKSYFNTDTFMLDIFDLNPDYLQVVCNNLILKYVEDDLVLSINVRHASLVSSDMNWETAFTELTPADLVMRKLLSVSDLTVCLDKRGAMGKIESYEVGGQLWIVLIFIKFIWTKSKL